MKMMLTKRLHLVCLVFFLALPVQNIAYGNDPLPSEAFSALPKISAVQISPDGEHLIFLVNIEDQTALACQHIESGNWIGIAKTDNKKFKFRKICWANNDTILFSAEFPFRRYLSVPTVETRIFAAKSDGSEKYDTLVEPRIPAKGEADHISQMQDNIISLLPDDPEHILMAIDFDEATLPSVYKVNVRTGARKRVQRPRAKVRDWMVDQQDVIRIGQTFDEDTISTSTLIYNPSSKKWVEAWKSEVFSDPPVTPLGFGADPNILYVRSDLNGKNAIFRVDVSKPGLHKELVVKDDDYDINGSLIYSPKTRDVVGVYHSESDGARIYWHEGYKKFQAAIDKALPDTTNYLIDFSKDMRRYIVYSTSDTAPGVYYIGDRDKHTLNVIEYEYPQLEGKLRGKRKITYTARDGKTIEGYLTMPAEYTHDAPGAAVILPHGGPMARDYGGFDYWAEFLASKGLVVFQPNFRGSSGYGWDFEMEALENFGLTMQDDLTDAADWLVEQKLADPERLAIVGASYGGYAALMGAVKTPDLFRCAVSFAGISDLVALRNSYRNYLSYQVAMKQFGTESKKMKSVSPCRQVDKINIPILLVHGENDRTVAIEQSRKMAKNLERENKVFTFIELEDGNHHLENQANRHKFFSAMDAFLDKYLLD
jgi:dipeptidyl aminopeptidase/acylaminoacyl peptidase